jgi:predicted lactoylglutathione lyase
MSSVNQQELYKKVSMYLDNALNMEEQSALMHEINTNPDCLAMLSKERNFREFVKSRIHRRTASPDLIQSIREKVRIAPA